jgi:hypothetical protein
MAVTPVRPTPDEFAPYYNTYVSKVFGENVLELLQEEHQKIVTFLEGVPEPKWDFRYAEGKWSIKEVLAHLNDSERVFAYRALRIARNDKTPMPGFDQDEWMEALTVDHLSPKDLMADYKSTRAASMSLFNSFTDEIWMRRGKASGYTFSVRALAYIIAGHEQHHLQIIKERYF